MAKRQRNSGLSIASIAPTIFGIVTALAVVAVLAFLVLPGRGDANDSGGLDDGTAINAPDIALLDRTETPTPVRTPKVHRVDDPLVIEATWTPSPVLPTETPFQTATSVTMPGFESTARALRTDTAVPFETSTPVVFTVPPTAVPTFRVLPTVPVVPPTQGPDAPTPSIAPVDPTQVAPTATPVVIEPTVIAPSPTKTIRPTRTVPPPSPTIVPPATETTVPTAIATSTETVSAPTSTSSATADPSTTVSVTPGPTGSVTVTVTPTPKDPRTPSPTVPGTTETPVGSPPP